MSVVCNFQIDDRGIRLSGKHIFIVWDCVKSLSLRPGRKVLHVEARKSRLELR